MCELLGKLAATLLLTSLVDAAGNHSNYMSMDRDEIRTREGKLLSFTTDDDGDVSIEMQFSVPFITVPVKRAMDFSKGTLAKFNVGAVAVTAAIVAVTGFLLPLLLKIIHKKVTPLPFNPVFGGRGKVNNPDNEWWRVLTLVDQALIEHNVDTTACMQRVVCTMVKNSMKKVSVGQASSSDKIIDGVVTNEWLRHLVVGTPVEAAIKHGQDGSNCSDEYRMCKVSPKTLATFAKQFSDAINFT